MPFKLPTLSILTVTTVFSLLTACTSMPTASLRTFSTATHDMNVSANETYRKIELAALDQSIFTAPDAPYTGEAFDPAAQINNFNLTPYFNVMSARLNVIEAYAQSLYVLSSTSNEDEINIASQNLAASISSLSDTPSGYTSQSAALAATMADGLGSWVTYNLRKRKLEEVLKTGQPALEIIAKETNEETMHLINYVAILKTSYVNRANANRPRYGTWERYQFDQLVAKRFADFDAMTLALSNINAAVGNLPAINTQLADTLDSSKNNTLSKKKLIDFAMQVKRLRDFEKSFPVL